MMASTRFKLTTVLCALPLAIVGAAFVLGASAPLWLWLAVLGVCAASCIGVWAKLFRRRTDPRLPPREGSHGSAVR